METSASRPRREMRNRLQPNVISFGGALSACARVAKWQHASALLREAQAMAGAWEQQTSSLRLFPSGPGPSSGH